MQPIRRISCFYPDGNTPIVARTSATFSHALHVHADLSWECCYMARGSATIDVGGRAWQMTTGSALVTPPEQPHGLAACSGRRMVAMFRQPVLENTPAEVRAEAISMQRAQASRMPTLIQVPPPRQPVVEGAFELLRQESLSNQSMKTSMCTVILSRLLLELLRSQPGPPSATEPAVNSAATRTVEQFCDELRTHLDYPWTLTDMTRRSGYSARQLHRLFRVVTALSPHQWLREERLRRACQLLAQTDDSVTAIGLDAGFGSRSQFHRVFRESTGVSPQHYREMMGSRH